MIKLPEIKLMNPKDLKVDDSNPNSMSKEKYEALKDSIKEFGFIQPIITNKDFLIADGFHRREAALELGLDKVSVVVLEVKEVNRRMIRQVMNKIRGKHSPKKDKDEFEFIIKEDGVFNISKMLPDDPVLTKLIDSDPEFNDSTEEVDEIYHHQIECPKCGHKFKKKKG